MEQFKHNHQATHTNQNRTGEFVVSMCKRRQSQTWRWRNNDLVSTLPISFAVA